MSRKKILLKNLLEEARKDFLIDLEEGQFFETIITVFPSEKIPKEDKNFLIEGGVFATKPLACCRKTKQEFIKENSPFSGWFKNPNKGDLLEVVKILEDGTGVFINRSIKENIIKEQYENKKIKFIHFGKLDILEGKIKRIYRNLGRFLEGEE